MRILAVIPSRLASTRLPEKPLALLLGKTLIEHVHTGAREALAAGLIDGLVVATDNPRIADAVTRFGGTVAMTRADHPTGSDRIAEVAQAYPSAEIIVNIQGDEPLVNAEVVRSLLAPFSDPACTMSTLAKPITDAADLLNPNVVKVVVDRRGRALYFSRSTIPYDRDKKGAPVYRHLGYYAFRRDFLATYIRLSRTPLEQTENLEQLRVLEHGYPIHVGFTDVETVDVNAPEDLPRAEALLAKRGR